MTVSELISVLRKKYKNVEVSYLHPNLYVFCLDMKFSNLDMETRMTLLTKDVELEDSILENLLSTAMVELIPCSCEERSDEYDFVPEAKNSSHWLPLIDEVTRTKWTTKKRLVRSVHFYGYKGGQARSTVLGMLAKSLAEDGLRVLVVDADLEAPSLSVQFNTPVTELSQTLMGLCGWSASVEPLRVHRASGSAGTVDLIACRPTPSKFDMDYASFVVQASVDLTLLQRGVNRLAEIVEEQPQQYDLVFFDHRTGLSTSVLPIMSEWAGSVVIAARLDGLSLEATPFYGALFTSNPSAPGAFVAFTLDPEDSNERIHGRYRKMVEQMLFPLGDAIAQGAEDQESLSADVLVDYWINWFHDRSLLKEQLPSVNSLSKDNLSGIRELKTALDLFSVGEMRSYKSTADSIKSSPSGAEDEGIFLETARVSQVYQKHSPYTYVLGRKGTGKTRIFRELINAGLGEPLFATPDTPFSGVVKSVSSSFERFTSVCNGDFSLLWWSLLWVRLQLPSKPTDEQLNKSIEKWVELTKDERKTRCSASGVVDMLRNSQAPPRVLLIDGVETAVSSSELDDFVEELLRFIATIQYDTYLSEHIKIRLFIRSDLVSFSTQNIEQQVANRTIDLVWDQDSIFNFLLSRIQENAWFQDSFPIACEKIRSKLQTIQRGGLDEEQYRGLILEVFPEKLRRNNIQTFTFLRTYFSDAGGDSDKRTMFYPRLIEQFVRRVVELATTEGKGALEDGRLRHDLVLDAHKFASEDFLKEIKQELSTSLRLSTDRRENDKKISELIESLEGVATPFNVDELVIQLSITTDQQKTLVRESLNKLRELGFFEERPGYARQWRAGQLYKSALRMKYVRGRKA